ncbi:hypothetical protein [Mesorhizobium sp. M0578]|uniref:hypothetical protein n=1 Tax=unclassified Mesorhizobium TaxID=325217 RepID=UPI00333B9F9B
MAGTDRSFLDGGGAAQNRSVTTVGGRDVSRQILVDETDTPSLGAAADAAASSDAGTFSLISLFKRLLSVKLPSTLGPKTGANSFSVTLSSDDDVLIGGLTETSPANDTASSGLNGRLQRIAQNITTLIASTLSVRAADGIVTVSVDITRPADTTTYAINDALSDSTSAPTVGGFTFANAVRAAGKSAILTDLVVTSSNPAATALQGELYIFDTAFTAINDNAAFGVSDAEIKTLVAKIPFAMAVGTNNNHVHVQNLGIALTAIGGRDFRFGVKVLNAYVPANAEVITFRAKFAPVD